MAKIEMVITDFGGVLTTPLNEAFLSFQDRLEVPPETFGIVMKEIFEKTGKHPLFELECGRLTEAEFDDQLATALTPHIGHRPDIRQFGLDLFGQLEVNQGMIDLIREVKRDGYRAALLTNNVKEWEKLWREMIPVDELFETVVDSAFVGVRKSDPRIYELTLGRVGLPAEACIFIDDMKINCDAAAELGIHAVHFRETAQARAEVHEILSAGS